MKEEHLADYSVCTVHVTVVRLEGGDNVRATFDSVRLPDGKQRQQGTGRVTSTVPSQSWDFPEDTAILWAWMVATTPRNECGGLQRGWSKERRSTWQPWAQN